MPLRVRGVLENLDVAIKAFKQYFWVLVGWAAIVNGINSIPGVSYFSYFFTPPLMVGAAACCVAAAVRGQRVSFAQCWRFTQPRYWSIVGMHVCSLLVAGLLIGILIGVGVAMAIGGAYVFGNIPTELAAVGVVFSSVIGIVLFGVAITAISAWNTLVGIVACMEDDKRNSRALARAYELLRGQWRSVIGLMMLLGMGMLILWMIIGAAGAVMGGLTALRDLISGTPSDSTAWLAIAGFFFSSWLVLTFYMPIHYLAMTLVYLDLRVRKEALDIEWTAHQTAPTPVATWDPTPPQPTSFNSMPAQWDTGAPGISTVPGAYTTNPAAAPYTPSITPDAFAASPGAPPSAAQSHTPNPLALSNPDTPPQSTFIAPTPPPQASSDHTPSESGATTSFTQSTFPLASAAEDAHPGSGDNRTQPAPEQQNATTTETPAPATSNQAPSPEAPPETPSVSAPRW
ncbi:MAG: hypothetical protein JWN98_783 [Abditibacteriota bacterium]|nr:hypothetical protein [Abditibacteriota bacterium]